MPNAASPRRQKILHPKVVAVCCQNFIGHLTRLMNSLSKAKCEYFVERHLPGAVARGPTSEEVAVYGWHPGTRCCPSRDITAADAHSCSPEGADLGSGTIVWETAWFMGPKICNRTD